MKAFVVLLWCFLPASVLAEVVIPKASVDNHVNIRASASAQSEDIGDLLPGASLPFLRSVPYWYEVRLPDGRNGFVSKGWTEVVEIAPTPSTPFTVHFIDVGVGDAAIIDMGEREIIIDGGNYANDLVNYATENELIQGNVELVIVTHSDQDHWKGLRRFLGFDGMLDSPFTMEEYWDAGYNRDCNPDSSGGKRNYLQFVRDVDALLDEAHFKRPLQNFHAPADQSGNIVPFTLPSLPGVTFTLLHSDSNPTEGSCSYKINNASIVLKLDIAGVSMLFTGDANGKERDEEGDVTPSHVEASLLALNAQHGGTILNVDLLKVPHHGSETASTQAFINQVDPDFVIISAATNHHLPRQTVVNRAVV